MILRVAEGIPTELDGKAIPLAELIMQCNKIGGEHGVGVFNLIEDRIDWSKS
ncbi:hypothetical protein ACP8HZ_01295 [Francisella noatunensis]